MDTMEDEGMTKVVSLTEYSSRKQDKNNSGTHKNNKGAMSVGDVVDWVNDDLNALADTLGVSREKAYEVAKGFHDKYPALLSYVGEPQFRKDNPIDL